MTSSHEQKIRKMLNLRPDDKPMGWDKDWPPPIPARVMRVVDRAEQYTRNQRGGHGASVEMENGSLVNLVAMALELDTVGTTGIAQPPKVDLAEAELGIMALRKKVQEKTGAKWEEVMKCNKPKLQEMLNG